MQLQRFVLDDYVYLQQTVPIILNVIANRAIMRIKKVFSNDVLELEGHDG